MLHIVTKRNRELYRDEMADLFRIRKTVFVDDLGWQLPVTNGLEIDRYDDDRAVYGLAFDAAGRVTMGARYRPTDDHAMLTDVFPHAVDPRFGPVTGPEVWEITRGMCLESGRQPHNLMRRAIQALAPIEYALAHGVRWLIAFAEVRLVPLAIAMGWRIELLGEPTPFGEGVGIAFRIEVSDDAVRQIREEFGLPMPCYVELAPRPGDARDVHSRAAEMAHRVPGLAASLPQAGDRRVVGDMLLRGARRSRLDSRALAWVRRNAGPAAPAMESQVRA